MKLYKIVRYKFNAENEVLKENVTLKEAMDHCGSEDTRGPDWFDGFTEMDDNEDLLGEEYNQ